MHYSVIPIAIQVFIALRISSSEYLAAKIMIDATVVQ